MKPEVTLILIVILIILGGYIYFFEWVDRAGDQANDPLLIYGTTYGEYDVVALEISGPQGQAHFARTDDGLTRDWQMLQPASLPSEELDQVRVNGAATRLAHLTASRVITEVADLAQYGLESPALTVTLTLSNGRRIDLYAGAPTVVNDNRYLMTAEDDRTVYTIYGFAIEDLIGLLEQPPLAPTPLPTLSP